MTDLSNTTSASSATETEAGPSSPSSKLPAPRSQQPCSVCSSEGSKYTCPRCSTRTCSLRCTKQHKADTGCSGERDRTGYVAMDAYGDISMWRDLGYLREVGEKLKEWGVGVRGGGGNDVSSGGSSSSSSKQHANNARLMNHPSDKGKGRDRDPAAPRSGPGPSGGKAAVPDSILHLPTKDLKFKKELARKGIELLYLPAEMERHKANQSGHSRRKRKSVLTVTLSVFDDGGGKVCSKTIHQNELTASLKTLMESTLPTKVSQASLQDHYTVLLPVPIRPSVYVSKNALPERAPRALPTPPPAKEAPKSLHASLPMKPTWTTGDASSMPAQPTDPPPALPATEEASTLSSTVQSVKPSFDRFSRRVWQVPLTDDLSVEESLKGTTVLEWPEYELWPTSVIDKLVEDGKVQYMPRRDTHRTRGDHPQKRKADALDTAEDQKDDIDQDAEEGGPSPTQADAEVAAGTLVQAGGGGAEDSDGTSDTDEDKDPIDEMATPGDLVSGDA